MPEEECTEDPAGWTCRGSAAGPADAGGRLLETLDEEPKMDPALDWAGVTEPMAEA